MRSVLKASAVLGASSVVVIALGIVRTKVVALGLGPGGVGQLGQLLTFVTLGATLFGLGLGNSGVRYTASAHDEGPDAQAETAGALVYGAHALGLLGALAVLAFEAPLRGVWGGGVPVRGWALWAALGVWATVAATGHVALLNGARRVADFAKTNVSGALVGTVATVPAVLLGREAGVIAAVVGAPLGTLMAAALLTRGVRKGAPWSFGARRRFGRMATLGGAFAAALTLSAATQFFARLFIAQRLGHDAAGHFQAVWSVSGLYLGFVLSALGAEYYPRLSALVADPSALGVAVADEVRMALALVAPVVAGAVVAAPLVAILLYSPQFLPMVPLLRWQLAGDVLKVAGWAFAFLLLAQESKGAYFLAELSWNVLYVAGVAWVVPAFGLSAAGPLYAACYAVYLVVVVTAVRRRLRIPGAPSLALRVGGYTVAIAFVAGVADLGATGLVVASGAVIGVGILALHDLRTAMALPAAGPLSFLRRWIRRPSFDRS